MWKLVLLTAAAALLSAPASLWGQAPPEKLLSALRSVGPEGAGSAEAAAAWRELVGRGPSVLPELIVGLTGADVRAANWIRSAAEAIAERELSAGRALPKERLEGLVLDAKLGGPARRLAYELLCRADATAEARLVDRFRDDPAPELRRDAVAKLIAEADAVAKANAGTNTSPAANADRSLAAAAYGRALHFARDSDQVTAIAGKLAELGVRVDLPAQLGHLRRWFLLGPFDGPKTSGFATEYAPEKSLAEPDLKATFPGKGDEVCRWKEHVTGRPDGAVDLNLALGRHKGAVAFGLAAVVSDAARPVELRIGSPNAVRVWLNGRELFAFEEYHHGAGPDQYICRGTLAKGRNNIVVKICQNEQTEHWAQEWNFQLRVIDATGTPVPLKPWVPEAKQGGN